MQSFINKHTSLAILLLILGCFFSGFYIGELTERAKYVSGASAIPSNCPPGMQCY
ncbi:MAG: hypothetical protein KA052_03165 [Candidatus Pacebacteria bacterium]|nr:hypothetical protein [Candidatus Paceibacterota bacterium]